MLKTCQYELWAPSSSGKPLEFTEFIITASLNWGLSGSRATAKIVMAPTAKKQLMNVKRGSQFLLRWGFTPKAYTKVVLYWTGTIWEIGEGATVSIDLVHGSWATTRTPVVGTFSEAKVDKVLAKIVKDKGVKLKTDKAKPPVSGVDTKNIAVSQTAAQEIERQYKGQFITADKDGTTLQVTSFENLSKTAQAYYISTEYGYLDKLNISYKAVVPKDKSYLEMIGGNKTPANSSPNTNPSASSNAAQTTALKPPYPTYVTIISTAEVNKLKNPILDLVIIVNNQEIGRYKCTSAKAFLRDSSKRNNVIPDGQYTIASSTIAGVSPEVGGLFLPITPNFKTNRSDLGIHFDPSFNKNNGEDGTRGCIGLTTASDRALVQRQILENKIKILIVSLDKDPEQKLAPAAKEQDKTAVSSHLVIDLASNQVYSESSKRGLIKSVGSMFKLFIAIAAINKLPTTSANTSLLSSMLDESSNTAANSLIQALGGIAAVNNFCKANGFLKTELDSLYAEKVGKKQSTANDLCNAFKLIFTQSKYASLRPYLVGSSLGLAGETHTKLGTNSAFEGGVSIIANTQGQKTIVCVLSNNTQGVKQIVKRIAGKVP